MVDKVKKAERVKASHLLGIDSPMVIWRTDLDTLGLGGDHPGGVEAGGGPTSEPPPAPQSIQYLATCDAVNHEPADDVVDGRWLGALVQTWEEANARVSQHPDGWAYVAMYIDGVQIGPVVHH